MSSTLNLPKPNATEDENGSDQQMWLNFEVSYTDHKQIIGRAGASINKIMRSTKCHIHLPDLNISSSSVRINEATVYGTPNNIESARAEIRLSMNVTYCLEVDMKRIDIGLIPQAEYFDGPIEMFHHNKCLKIRGQAKFSDELFVAVKYVLGWMTDNRVTVRSKYLKLEVTDVHRNWICGPNNKNLLTIMESTDTRIECHKRSDTPYRHQMTFVIHGDVENMFEARRRLIGSLPVTLMYSIPPEVRSRLNVSSRVPNVLVSCRRTKIGADTLFIQGHERNIGAVYKEMRRILDRGEHPNGFHLPVFPILDHRDSSTPETDESEVTLPSPSGSVSPPGISEVTYMNDNQHGSILSDDFLVTTETLGRAVRNDILSSIDFPPLSGSIVDDTPSGAMPTCSNTCWDVSLGSKEPTLTDRYPGSPFDMRGVCDKPQVGLPFYCPKCSHYLGPSSEGLFDYTPLKTSCTTLSDMATICDPDIFPFGGQRPSQKVTTDILLIYRFLQNLQLEKYMGKFICNDIDFPTLLTLSEDDLHIIGVTTFGAKRRLSLAIKALNEELFPRDDFPVTPLM